MRGGTEGVLIGLEAVVRCYAVAAVEAEHGKRLALQRLSGVVVLTRTEQTDTGMSETARGHRDFVKAA